MAWLWGGGWSSNGKCPCAGSLSHTTHRRHLFWIKLSPLNNISLRSGNGRSLLISGGPTLQGSLPVERSLEDSSLSPSADLIEELLKMTGQLEQHQNQVKRD